MIMFFAVDSGPVPTNWRKKRVEAWLRTLFAGTGT